MNCPACTNKLSEVDVDGIKVDVCKKGCGGIWFDWHELSKVDEPHESVGEILLYIERDQNIDVNHNIKRRCPRCVEEIYMLKHFSSAKKEIEVDECGNCGGFWLDHGELNSLRKQFKSQEERQQYAKRYISDLFDPILENERKKTQNNLSKSRNMAKVFKFICPTAYLPGEQDYGAF